MLSASAFSLDASQWTSTMSVASSKATKASASVAVEAVMVLEVGNRLQSGEQLVFLVSMARSRMSPTAPALRSSLSGRRSAICSRRPQRRCCSRWQWVHSATSSFTSGGLMVGTRRPACRAARARGLRVGADQAGLFASVRARDCLLVRRRRWLRCRARRPAPKSEACRPIRNRRTAPR